MMDVADIRAKYTDEAIHNMISRNMNMNKRIAELPISKDQFKKNAENTYYEQELADEKLAEERAKEEEERVKKDALLSEPRNKITTNGNYIIISKDNNKDENKRDDDPIYKELKRVNPRIAILVEGFDDNDGVNDGVDDIFKDLCKTCTDSEKLYIILSTESYWNVGNRGKPFNKLIKEYDNYKKVNGEEARYAWRMRNALTEETFLGGKKKTKRKKRKHVKSKKSRKTRKYVKSRKQRKSRRKN